MRKSLLIFVATRLEVKSLPSSPHSWGSGETPFALWSFCFPLSLSDELQKLGIQCFYHNSRLVAWADVIFLCCLSSQVPHICSEIQTSLGKACIVYSFVAAVPIPRYLVRVSTEPAEVWSPQLWLLPPTCSQPLPLGAGRSQWWGESSFPGRRTQWPFSCLCKLHLWWELDFYVQMCRTAVEPSTTWSWLVLPCASVGTETTRQWHEVIESVSYIVFVPLVSSPVPGKW